MDASNAELVINESSQSTDGTLSHLQEHQIPPVGLELNVGGESGDIGTNVSKKRARSSLYWTSNWFIPLDPKANPDGRPRAQCTKCKQVFLVDPMKNGTSTLNKHMKKCPKRENEDINQMLMQQTGGIFNTKDLKVDPNVVREKALALIVQNELPLKFVEYEKFKNLMLYVYPAETDPDQDGEQLFEALGEVFSSPLVPS
ncbi:hypothetical protein NE237_020953 [Protea cynaroides]|uniref:BED-type domain-containing protein n=1 Tax=Protea cynaroides TaxID=273540 RepID=A0A9Q0HA75_9MAGN|nr:hypothetical protein NE237_020953 [Protea cynaroides]